MLSATLSAQEPTADQKRIAALEAQIKKLTAPSPEQAVKDAQARIATDLKALRDQIAPGCKAIGGKWAITLNKAGEVVGVTCTQK